VKAAYLFAWLLLLRIEEVIRLEFESIDVIPGERKEIFIIIIIVPRKMLTSNLLRRRVL
jgi:hypothetical protein